MIFTRNVNNCLSVGFFDETEPRSQLVWASYGRNENAAKNAEYWECDETECEQWGTRRSLSFSDVVSLLAIPDSVPDVPPLSRFLRSGC